MFVPGRHSCYVDNSRQTGNTFLVSLAPTKSYGVGSETARSKSKLWALGSYFVP